MTGGLNTDFFHFDFALGGDNLTAIMDFTPGTDRIAMHPDYFPAINGANNLVTADEFTMGAAAQDAEDRIIYNNGTGALMYDADGTGPAGAVHFATLSLNLNLTHADFIFA